jgi:mono/diheme cytochrome c family protein
MLVTHTREATETIMSEKINKVETVKPGPSKVHGTVAEFETVDSLMSACRKFRDAGFKDIDAYTPFPVHHIDEALGIKPTHLPWIALVCGLIGTTTAMVMQIWMNGIDYPYIISGKPFVSWPTFIPVAFELTILFASFGTFFGMWALNKLPRFSNPVFTDPRFDRATDDKFFLYVGAGDAKYSQSGVEKMMSETGSGYINKVLSDESSAKVPRLVFLVWMAALGLSVVPLLIAIKMRLTKSDQPRFHVFHEMDYSPAKDAQQSTSLFADSRAMRPDVRGTVARGQAEMDVLTGIDMEKLTSIDPGRANRLVAMYDEAKSADTVNDVNAAASPDPKPSPAPEPAVPKSVMDTTPWLSQIPFTVDEDFVYKGQEKFNIYCAVCHGNNGGGNGLVNRRAKKILAANWLPPSNLHDTTLHQDLYADGKLFSTISNGIRKMPGYASQIKVEDRWAIVAYVRALQASRGGSIEQVPTDQRTQIESAKVAIEVKLREEKLKEAQKQEQKK